jgi:pimeloyl-ACP methyl ester carboxylesterase
VHVERQVFDVLAYLIAHRDRVVTKTELLDNVWGDRFVSDSALSSRIKAARRAVDDDGARQEVIRTVFGRGYQFVAEVDEDRMATPPALPPSPPIEQKILFCLADDGTRIAYSLVGDGPVLVKAANWMTHLAYDHESPVWRHWTGDIAARRTLLRYDERGCGMSDWDVDRFDFEAWVEDLEVVVDSAGLDRFPLLGVSQGGAVAVAFAVRHPERVSRMVLYGSYARGRRVRAADAGSRDEAALDIELARVGWGRDDPSFRQVFTSQFLPDGSRADWDEFNDFLRRTTSTENAVRFLETFAQIDVTGEAPKVTCPTLVVHARDDHRVPASAARELAALIPGSRFVLLPGRNHLLRRDEPAWPQFLAELDGFLEAERS